MIPTGLGMGKGKYKPIMLSLHQIYYSGKITRILEAFAWGQRGKMKSHKIALPMEFYMSVYTPLTTKCTKLMVLKRGQNKNTARRRPKLS